MVEWLERTLWSKTEDDLLFTGLTWMSVGMFRWTFHSCRS